MIVTLVYKLVFKHFKKFQIEREISLTSSLTETTTLLVVNGDAILLKKHRSKTVCCRAVGQVVNKIRLRIKNSK